MSSTCGRYRSDGKAAPLGDILTNTNPYSEETCRAQRGLHCGSGVNAPALSQAARKGNVHNTFHCFLVQVLDFMIVSPSLHLSVFIYLSSQPANILTNSEGKTKVN